MKPPAGWKQIRLHHVAEVRTGLSKSAKREGTTVKKPYLRVANVQDGFLDLSEIKEIDVPASQVARFTLKPGDLLLIEGNGNPENLGRGCIWDGQIAECVHQNHVFAVRANPEEEMVPAFLALQLQSDHGRNYLLSCAKGSTGLATLNSAQLRDFPLLAPSIAEQRSITLAISTWDNATQKTEQLIAAKDLSIKGIMQRVFRMGSYQRIPLSDFTRRISRKNVDGKGHPLTISGADGLVSQSRYFSKRIAAENTEHYTLLNRGEFAYNKSYSAGYPLGAIKRLDTHDEGIVSTLYLCFVLDGSKAPLSDYFAYFCEAGGFNHQIYQIAQEGARNHGLLNVTAEDFFSMKMPVPARDAQERAVKVLGAAMREARLLRNQLAALRAQKRGLMQKLLTGQWRLTASHQVAAKK